jgi:hypothetical protein
MHVHVHLQFACIDPHCHQGTNSCMRDKRHSLQVPCATLASLRSTSGGKTHLTRTLAVGTVCDMLQEMELSMPEDEAYQVCVHVCVCVCVCV